MSSILSHRGYSIKKDTLSLDELRTLKKALTVTPIAHPDFPISPSFSVFEEGKLWIRIPRAFGLEKFGIPKVDRLEDKLLQQERCSFNGTLRENQLVPHQKVLDGLLNKGSGLLCLQTGGGKSVCMLSLLSHLKQRTCILVHKSQLLQQWKDEIARFLPKMTVGIIQQEKKSFAEECDVYLIMIQTLLKMDNIPAIFGFTVIDECHHLPSSTFSKILFKVNAKFVLGLSATPKRKDGLTNVLHWHMGETLFEEKPDRSDQSTTYVHLYSYSNGGNIDPRKYAEMITNLCSDKDRTALIISAIKEQLTNDKTKKRQVLILSERKSHATLIFKELQNIYNGKRSCGLLLGGMKKHVLESEMKKDILVATYNLMSEGISISKLNTILFASPKRDVTQALGRIFRQVHKDVNPMIIDISDSALRGQQQARMKIYKKELNGNIHVINHTQGMMESDEEEHPLSGKALSLESSDDDS